jgi:hypothetical protein
VVARSLERAEWRGCTSVVLEKSISLSSSTPRTSFEGNDISGIDTGYPVRDAVTVFGITQLRSRSSCSSFAYVQMVCGAVG